MNKILRIIKTFKLKYFVYNTISLFRDNKKEKQRFTDEELLTIKQKLKSTQQDLLYFKIIDYFNNNHSLEYELELFNLREKSQILLFPYKQLKFIENFESGFDPEKNLPYIIHKRDKKIYFPQSYSISQAKSEYISLIEEQSILGGNYSQKSPHQYQSDIISVKKNDIVLDIGAAEGLFALDVLDLAKKVYIFECDEKWLAPLKATFEPYNHKVIIINKLVSDIDSHNKIRIDTCLKNEELEGVFLKLDIEGDESLVLTGNKSFLEQNIDIRISCCTYHRYDDADFMNDFLNNIGYKTEYSDGYMIFVHDVENMKPPYFRRGLIRSQKILM